MAVWVNLFYISLSLCITRVVSQFQLQPVNVTVLKGSDAQMNATVPTGWQSMTWAVDDTPVLVFNPSGNGTASSNRYSASFCITDNTECVQFIIQNVTRNDKVVECSVLGIQGSQTARLDVQESGTVNIRGGDVAVERGQQVEFQCDTSAWYPEPDVGWTLNGAAVDSITYNTTSIADGDFYNSTSVLNFNAISNTTVECRATVAALNNPISSSVFLTVASGPEPPDWTVLIAVVVSIGGLALLVLLIVGIIFCCRRRKEKQSNYQNEMTRRVRTQSEINGQTVAGQEQGHVNTQYLSDSHSRWSQSEIDFSSSSIRKMPANYSANHGRQEISTVTGSNFTKHRHATIV
ncbi:immunoglobulin superfamily member 5 [Nelusetta ayraudi]|uniref:immunoglobulin superfamily member 5 n=1 Tax=Nelusetta ayraudi TaxID=303726 RepID=UPI003F721602